MHEEKEWYLSKTSTTSVESILLGRSIEEKFTIFPKIKLRTNSFFF
jgi:hypothetical protein